MANNDQRLFEYLPAANPPAALGRGVLFQISLAARRAARQRVAWFGVLVSSSLLALISAFSYLATELASSGFTQYVALIVSDNASILAVWRDLGLSLVESLPVVAIIGCLSLFIILFWSSLKLITNAYEIQFTRIQSV